MQAISILQRLLRDTRGATAVEYGLIVSLIVIAMITSMSAFADESSGLWAKVMDQVELVM